MKNVVQLLWSKPAPRDWTNQDLADFYRVESALVQAGLSIETERGLSDEGEPWFAFCHAETQDVIVHCARIDGLYVVASAAFDGVLRGPDFRTVVEGVLERHPLVMPRQKEGAGNVRFHPSALLVALVATAFFKLSGDAQAHDGTIDFDVSASSSRFDFSALKHLLIDFDKRQAALIVAAMVYVHSDMGRGTFTEQGVAHAEVFADGGSDQEVARTDSVDHLFEQFIGQKADVEGGSHGDTHTPVLGLADGQDLTSWTLALVADAVRAEAPTVKPEAELAFDMSLAHGAEHSSVVSPILVVAKADIDIGSNLVANAKAEQEASLTSQSTVSGSSDAKQVVTNADAQKFVQSLISEFTTGIVGSQLTETTKEQVVAALTNATEAAQVVSSGPAVTIPQDLSVTTNLLKGHILEEIKTHYDTSKLSETVQAAGTTVQDMVKDFVLNTLDFHSITSGKNIIFYDPTPTGFHDEKFVTVVFDDQSTISLIGSFDILANAA